MNDNKVVEITDFHREQAKVYFSKLQPIAPGDRMAMLSRSIEMSSSSNPIVAARGRSLKTIGVPLMDYYANESERGLQVEFIVLESTEVFCLFAAGKMAEALSPQHAYGQTRHFLMKLMQTAEVHANGVLRQVLAHFIKTAKVENVKEATNEGADIRHGDDGPPEPKAAG